VVLKSILTFDVDGLKDLSTGFPSIRALMLFLFFRKLGENGKSTAAEIGENITALKNTLDSRNIAKIVIQRKIDTSQISEA
jgi:hypothetical protein